MIENSVVYRFFAGLGAFLLGSLQQSALVGVFLTDNRNQVIAARRSVLGRLFRAVCRFFQRFFRVFGLDRLLLGSIFKQCYLWMFLPVVLAPFLPTMLVILLSVAGFFSVALRLFAERRRRLLSHPMVVYIVRYALIYTAAIFTSVTISGSLYGGMVTVCFVLFSLVVFNAIESKRQVQVLLFCLTAGGVLVALYGFYQFLFQDKFGGVWVDTDMFEGMFRVYSTFQNPNVLGEYFLLMVPLAVAGFFISKSLVMRLYYLGSVGVMMLCLVLTYSRGCYLGILAAAFLFLVLLDKRFVLLGVVGLLLLPFVLPESILNRFMSIGNLEDSSTSYRVYIWLGTIAMLKDYWISGVGPGEAAYNMVYPVYGYNGISAPHAHNTFLQVTCDTGFFGLALFLCLLYQFFKAVFRSYLQTEDRTGRLLMIGVMSAVAGFLVQSLFDYTFYNYRVMFLFWAMIGFGMVISRYDRLREV